MGELHQLNHESGLSLDFRLPPIARQDIGTRIHEVFEEMRRAYSALGGMFIISKKLHAQMVEHGGEGFASQFATYDEPFVHSKEPDGYKRLPNGRLMPIIKKSTGPAVDPHRKRGKR